jgi:hypothetical protein
VPSLATNATGNVQIIHASAIIATSLDLSLTTGLSFDTVFVQRQRGKRRAA